jgi:DNA polymerase-3 subunit alpha
MDVFLFGKDIVRLDGLLKEGNVLLITGRNEPKYKSEEEYEFKMSDAQLLENLDVSFSSLIAEIDLDTFGLKEMDELEELLKGHSGGTSISFHIKARLETEAGIEIVKLPMKINNYKVKLSENFLVKIKRIPGISYVELKDN